MRLGPAGRGGTGPPFLRWPAVRLLGEPQARGQSEIGAVVGAAGPRACTELQGDRRTWRSSIRDRRQGAGIGAAAPRVLRGTARGAREGSSTARAGPRVWRHRGAGRGRDSSQCPGGRREYGVCRPSSHSFAAVRRTDTLAPEVCRREPAGGHQQAGAGSTARFGSSCANPGT